MLAGAADGKFTEIDYPTTKYGSARTWVQTKDLVTEPTDIEGRAVCGAILQLRADKKTEARRARGSRAWPVCRQQAPATARCQGRAAEGRRRHRGQGRGVGPSHGAGRLRVDLGGTGYLPVFQERCCETATSGPRMVQDPDHLPLMIGLERGWFADAGLDLT